MNKQQYLNQKKNQLSEQQIDRRQFVVHALAAGLTLPTALSMADQVLAATPKRGGTFRVGIGDGSTSDNLDPATAENDFNAGVHFTYGNYLTEVDSNGNLIGELAESFEPVNNGKTWIFNLRKGVEFHNGKTMDADDIVASFQHHMGKDSKSAAKGLVNQITRMTKDGNYRVIFDLANANADFAYTVSDYHLTILSSKNGTVNTTDGIGTGGYRLENYEPGVQATFSRNPNYFKPHRAHFDSLEILAIHDATARQNAIINGEVDHAYRIPTKVVKLLQRVPSLRIIETTGTLHYTMPMRLDAKPFDNYDMRMALKYAVNRQEMVNKILFGHGALGNDLPISPSTPFYNTEIPQREFDLDKAVFHFKKSGFDGTLQLSSSEAAFDGANNAAQLIAASAAKVGISVEVVREPSDGYWANVWNKKPWCTCYWSGRPTQDWMYSSGYVADSEWNDTAWRTTKAAKRFNELVIYARGETDTPKRKAAYFEAQQLLHDDGGALIPMFANYIHATSKKVATPEKIAANWVNDGMRAPERWWFA